MESVRHQLDSKRTKRALSDPLSARHRRMLEVESGISPEVIGARGYRTVTSSAELQSIGFADYQTKVPALLLPSWSVTGNQVGWQIRPDKPRTDKKSDKPIKYESPPGSHPVADVNPSRLYALYNPTCRLWVTEGKRKADALASIGEVCISLDGVYGWWRRDSEGVSKPIDDFDDIPLERRQVVLAFDSDVVRKSEVRSALQGLAAHLSERKADVQIVLLPDGPAKVGIDDFLVAGGTIESLMELVRPAAEAFKVLQGNSLASTSELPAAYADVAPRAISWLWPGRLAQGMIALIDGDPGLGKSLLTIEIAARLSSGRPLPGSAPRAPVDVILINYEDAMAEVIVPRLLAAGADLNRVHPILLPDAVGGRSPTFPNDLSLVAAKIREYKAALVIVDPLMAAFSPDVNSHRDQDVRRVLAPIARIAEDTQAAFLFIRHLNKAEHLSALHRGGGSIGIIAAARIAMMVTAEGDSQNQRLLIVNKTNLGMKPDAIQFTVIGEDETVGRLTWGDEVKITADQALAGKAPQPGSPRLTEAIGFLLTELRSEARPAAEVEALATAAGISSKTLERAAKTMGVKKAKGGFAGSDAGWWWELPAEALVSAGMVKVEDGARAFPGSSSQRGGLRDDLRTSVTPFDREPRFDSAAFLQDGHEEDQSLVQNELGTLGS